MGYKNLLSVILGLLQGIILTRLGCPLFNIYFYFRNDDGINIIHISDIFSRGEKPREETWLFSMLKDNIRNETISLVHFNFLGLQVSYE